MLNSHSFQVGDTAFYILDDNPFFKIRKTRIAEITKKPSQIFFERYCFLCEDGHCFESVESFVPNFVYPTKNDAVSYIMTQLRTSMEDEKLCIVSTFQRLERLQVSLRVYTAASAGHEDAPANPTYAYRIDDDNDHYVIRRTSLRRLLGDLGPGADFNAFGCRDLGNGVRLSYICRSKEQAAYRITQFLRADIARLEIDYTNAEACLEQARRSLKLYERYLESD